MTSADLTPAEATTVTQASPVDISAIFVTYNHAEFVERALDRVIDQ